MKTFLLTTGLCLVSLMTSTPRADACNPRPVMVQPVPYPIRPVPLVQPVPRPIPVPMQTSNGGNQVVWDLPQEEKARLRAAARIDAGGFKPAPVRMRDAAESTPPPARPLPERVARAIAAHKELTAAVERLVAKRAEIERWDSLAQEKFQRAFGTKDDKVRQAVLTRIDQQLQDSSRALASLSDTIRFEFYVSLNKRK